MSGRAPAHLGEFPCTPWLFSINSHAWLKRRKNPTTYKPERNAEEVGEEEKWS